MVAWAREIYPFPRSLTGDGLRQTLSFFESMHSEYERLFFSSGENVFDWTVPKEWKITDAWIEHIGSGTRFAEFKKNHLHVLGYSSPVDQVLSKDELLSHIYTQPDQPDLIPYVTSYYKERWGFCLSENQKNNLPDGQYHVFIASDLFNGHLEMSHALIRGSTENELFFSSYVCHPSMANNEISGPVLLNALMGFIKDNFPKPRYSYRFLLAPETIGSLAYLSRHLDDLRKKVRCGYVLSCVGDERAYSHIQSRHGNSMADKVLQSALFGLKNVKTYNFLKRGSDERQYCAPGIDLPICGFCRSKYAEYPEYHTDADDFSVVTSKGLQGAFDVMKNIITAFEMGIYPETQVRGEPQLGKRGLYPTLSQKNQYADIRTRMDFLAYADGKADIFDIVRYIEKPLAAVLSEFRTLRDNGLVQSR